MANREIKTTLKLEGEQAYKKAVGNVNSELKVLSSEMKEVNSRYDTNEKSMKKLSEQSKILNSQYEAQQKKVKLLQDAVADSNKTYDKAVNKYDEMVQKFGENSKEAEKAARAVEKAQKAVDNFTIQLNGAEAGLNKLEGELKDIQGEMKDLNNLKVTDFVPDSAVESVEEAQKKLQKLATATKNVATAAGGAAKKMGEIGAATLSKGFEAGAAALTAYASAATAAATAIFNLTAEAGLFADDINTLSKQTGLDTGTLQELTYAADLIDVDVETIAKSMAKLTKNMTSTSKEVQGAFASLGVSIRDDVTGELRNNEEVFNDLITALGKVENETERDNLAMQIFGKSAQDLNPLILGGAEQLQKLSESARDAGLILSQEALDSLNGFNDSLDVLKGNLNASKNVLAGSFSGSLKKITDQIGKEIPEITNAFIMMFDPSTAKEGEEKFRAIINRLSSSIGKDIREMLPVFLNGMNAILEGVIAELPPAVSTLLPYLIDGLKSLVISVLDYVPELLPLVADAAITLFTGLIGGLNSVVEKLTPMLPGIIKDLSTTIIDSVPLIIETAFDFFVGLISGLAMAAPEILKSVSDLIPKISDEITKSGNLELLIQSGIDLIVALAEGLPQALPAIVGSIDDIIIAIVEAFSAVDWKDTSETIFVGIGDGLVGMFSSALTVIDNLLGTNLESWYADMASFNRELGATIYKALNQDKIDEIVTRQEYGAISRDLQQVANQYMREGFSAEEAFERAKNDVLNTAEKQIYYDEVVGKYVNLDLIRSNYNTLSSTGQIGNADYYSGLERQNSADYYAAIGRAALAEREYNETAAIIAGGGNTGENSTNTKTVINNFNSPKALSAQEQLTLAEKMKQLEQMYS